MTIAALRAMANRIPATLVTGKIRRWSARRWLMPLLGAILFAVLLGHVSAADLIEVLGQARPEHIAGAVLVGLLATVIRAVRFHAFFPALGRWLDLYATFALLRAINYVLPFRSGELIALALLKRRGLAPTIAEASPVWFLLRAADFAALLVLLAVSVVLAGSTLTDDWRVKALIVGTAAASIAALVAMPACARWWSKRGGQNAVPRWLDGRLRDLRNGLAHVTLPHAIAATLASALIIWSINITVVVLTLLAFNAPITLAECIFASIMGTTLNLLPIRAPLGLGTGDTIWAAVLMLLHVAVPTAVALAIGVRVVQMLLVGIDGGVGLLIPSRSAERSMPDG